jgi:hypothetical protein
LTSYFDIHSQPATILTRENETLTTHSLIISYTNPSLNDIVSNSSFTLTEHAKSTTLVGHKFTSILESHCVIPSSSRFIRWLDGIIGTLNSIHHLKSRFRTVKTEKTTSSGEIPQFVDIEWHAVVMKNKYVVLTGQIVGTTQLSTGLTSPLLIPPQCLRTPDAIEENLQNEMFKEHRSPLIVHSTDLKTSRIRRMGMNGGIPPANSTTEQSRLSSFSDDQPISECYTWQSNEKVCPTRNSINISLLKR